MGNRAEAKIQLGEETTPGTEVDTTTLWRGSWADFDDEEVPVFPEENIGMYSKADRAYIPWKGGTIEPPDTEATFEQLVHILQAGVDGVGTTGTWSLPTSAAGSPKTFTIESGDDQACGLATYGFVEEFHITGNAREGLMMGARWRVKSVDYAGSFTASVNIPSVEEILFGNGGLWIDNAGSLGGAQKSNTLLSIDFRASNLIGYKVTGDSLTLDATKQLEPEVTCAITFEHDGTATAERANMKAKTARDIRLKWTGTGTKALQIDMHGKWADFEMIDERDGNDIVEAMFNSRWDPDEASGVGNDFCEIVLTTY